MIILNDLILTCIDSKALYFVSFHHLFIHSDMAAMEFLVQVTAKWHLELQVFQYTWAIIVEMSPALPVFEFLNVANTYFGHYFVYHLEPAS